jgi:hypothetical protein
MTGGKKQQDEFRSELTRWKTRNECQDNPGQHQQNGLRNLESRGNDRNCGDNS